MNKKMTNVILIIGASFLLVGSGLHLLLPKTITEPASPIQNKTKKKTSPKLQAQHCLSELCITELEIVNDSSNIEVVNGTLTNESNQTIPAGCFKVTFELNSDNITKNFCYLELKPNQSVPLELQHQEKKLINAIDYKIEPLSKEELEQIKVE